MDLDQLIAKYPLTLREASIEVDIGWYSLLEEFAKECELLLNSPDWRQYSQSEDDQQILPQEEVIPHIKQIKEKFGTLRIHATWYDDRLSDLIDKYEAISEKICDQCGQPGVLYRKNGWLQVRCPYHKN